MMMKWYKQNCSKRIFEKALILLLASAVTGQAGVLTWNPETRKMALSAKDGKPWLSDGSAHVVLTNGQVISTSDTRFKVTVSEQHDRWVLSGSDEQKSLDWEMVVTSVDALSVRLDWTVFNSGTQALKLQQLTILSGKLEGLVDPENNRVLESGLHSWAGGKVVRLVPEKKIESHYTLALQSPPFAAGFLAGRHNLDKFTVNQGQAGLELAAYGECNQCVLPAGATRRADPLFLSSGGHPLRQMEVFADLAARENGVQLWPENFATWCSWYAGWMRQESLYEFKDGLEKGVEVNIPLVSKLLGTRGTPSMRVVDDSNEMPYGDWDNKTLAVGKGFHRLADLIKEQGILAGIWYPPYWVPMKSRIFQERPELLCKSDDGKVAVGNGASIPNSMYGNHLAFFDSSNPAAEAEMERAGRAWRERGFRYVMTDFMYWGAWQQKRFDPTLTAVESYTRGLAAMRRGYGKDTYWLHCGALLGPAMGVCDGMRISGDSHGDEMFSYESAAARWFYNWRVWINDPDAIVCRRYGATKGVEWNRCWMSWMALAGNVLTYGDAFDDLPAEYVDIYRRVLPPLPIAGRPLDLWENEPYLLWGMDPGVADGSYTLFGIFEFQAKRPDQKIRLNLDEVAARSRSWDQKPKEAPVTWLLWDFWGQKLTKVSGAHLTHPVPSKSCAVFALRADLGRPQLLGTSGHFSQGKLETQAITWKAKQGSLSGKVRGNGGEPTTLFFHIPAGMACKTASLGYHPVFPKIIEPGVLALDVPAVGDDPVPFELVFTGTPGKSATRPFTAGLVGEVKP
jgi:alpha-galactosidase